MQLTYMYRFFTQANLEEDFRLANLAQRTQKEIYKLYATRILVNLIVLALSALSAYLIFMAAQMSITVHYSVCKWICIIWSLWENFQKHLNCSRKCFSDFLKSSGFPWRYAVWSTVVFGISFELWCTARDYPLVCGNPRLNINMPSILFDWD